MTSLLRSWRYLLIPIVLGTILWVQASIVVAADAPQVVVSQFYQWYVQNQDHARERIAQQRAAFDPAFYQQLVQAFQKGPEDGAWLDVDPFSGTQVGTYRIAVKSIAKKDDFTAEVNIDVYAGLGPTRVEAVPIKVLLSNQNNTWQIQNIIYVRGWGNLLCELRAINRADCR